MMTDTCIFQALRDIATFEHGCNRSPSPDTCQQGCHSHEYYRGWRKSCNAWSPLIPGSYNASGAPGSAGFEHVHGHESYFL